MDLTSKEALARLVWAEIKASGQRQVEVAAIAGVSEKHISQLVQFRAGMQLDTIDKVLAACGRRLALTTEPIIEPSGGYDKANEIYRRLDEQGE